MNEKLKRNKINKYWPGGTILGVPAWLYDLPQKVESNKKLNQYWNRAVQLITNPNYRKHFISRHFGKKSEDVGADETFQNTYSPELTYDNAFIDLSQNAYASTGETPEGATSALASEFMEEINPSVFTAAKWKTLPSDYMLRDWKDMPLKDIRLFYGVEDGTFKIMPLDQFRDSTTIVPVRTPYGPGGLTSITGDKNYEEKYQNWRDTRDSLTSISNDAWWRLKDARDSTYFDRVVAPVMPELAKYGIVPDRNYRYSHITGHVSDAIRSEMPDSRYFNRYLFDQQSSLNPRLDSLKRLYYNLKDLPWAGDMHSPQIDSLNALYNAAKYNRDEWLDNNPKPEETLITFEDSTSSHSIPYSAYGKFLLGNSHGGFYINGSSVLNNSGVRRTLNNFIQTSGEPLYPAMVDNGSFGKHILDTVPQTRLIPKYLNQGYGVRPDSTNIFVIGTKLPSNKNGGVLKGQFGISNLPASNYPRPPYWTNERLNYCKYTPGSKPGIDACAAFSNQELRNLGANIYSNAWSLSGDITNVLNGFEGLTRPTTYSREGVEKYNGQAADNVKSQIASLTLDPNEAYAVNMYYKGSPSLQSAFTHGGDTGTHTGMLIFNNEKMRWEVVHNIHDKVYVDSLEDALGSGKQYGITSIYKTNIPDKPKSVDINSFGHMYYKNN